MSRWVPCSLALSLALAACEDGRAPVDAGFFRPDSGTPDSGAGRDGSVPMGQIQVQAVFDGDTVRVAASASVRTPDDKPMANEVIRFLGIDAPEIAHPPMSAQCWGDEAHAYLREQIQGRTVVLTFDVDEACPMPVQPSRAEACHLRDAFGRLLAYVALPDGTVLNERLVRLGHARSFRAFPHKFTTLYNQLEMQARADDIGLWTCP
jgi:micrococcal nuclease